MAHQQLWLLRHGEAVPHESKPDFDRELTARGERQSIAAGVTPEEREALGKEFDEQVARELLAEHEDGARILIVGHNPTFAQVVHDLTGATVDFKKGGVAAVRITGPGRGELIALLRPRELESIALGVQPTAEG